MMYSVRTTLNLDEDVIEAARALADSERRPLGQIVSELVRRGLVPHEARLGDEDGFPVFSVAQGAPVITPEMVQAGMDEV
jgi:hypothetical protein